MDRHSATKTGTAQHGQAYTEFINGGRSGKGLNTRARESLTPISKAETFTVPVLYYFKKKVTFLKLVLREGNQQRWEKLIFCCGSDLSAIVKSQIVRRRYVF